MAKYWIPGNVKTRLAEAVGIETAAQLHRRFVIHLCQTLAEIADRRELVVTPPTKLEMMQAAVADGWQGVPQSQGDLGARMLAWFQSVGREAENALDSPTLNARSPADRPRAILIGADCPLLKGAEIQQAFDLLKHHDVVLGPATDGGYYLIGLRLKWPMPTSREQTIAHLFHEIPWGTDRVLALTRRRIEQMELSLALLQEKSDVDHLDDLHHLREQLRFARPVQQDALPSPDAILADEIDRILDSIHSDRKHSSP